MEWITLNVEAQYDAVEKAWRGLLDRTPHSYYLSWGWVENWLTTLPPERRRDLDLLLVRHRGEDVAGMFAGRFRERHKGFRTRAIAVNATGDSAYDAIYIEFNAILCQPSFEGRLAGLIKCLPGPWDELVLPGLDPEQAPWLRAVRGEGLALSLKRDETAHYVALDALNGDDYLENLSRSTRSQIRRSFRICREGGADIVFEVAGTVDEAAAYFEQMLELHRHSWTAKGTTSNFDTPYVTAFHRRLVRQRFASGEIQMARLTVGGQTIGALYNLVYGGRVYAYQSGFRFSEDNRVKPGLMSHVEAVQHNAAQGLNSYEFLAGASRYKASLGTRTRRLVWARLQRPMPLFWLERQLKSAKQSVRKLTAPMALAVKRG